MKLILAFPLLFISASATAVPSLPALDQSTMTVRDECLQAIRGHAEQDAWAGGYGIVRIVAAIGREEDPGIFHCAARFERMGGPAGLSIGPWYEFYRPVKRE